MNTIEVYGFAEKKICAGCDGHECGTCAPGVKTQTIDLFTEFVTLLNDNPLGKTFKAEFIEATSSNIQRHPDVSNLLSMAELDPIIVIKGKVAYMGGFSPKGLLDEIEKNHNH